MPFNMQDDTHVEDEAAAEKRRINLVSSDGSDDDLEEEAGACEGCRCPGSSQGICCCTPQAQGPSLKARLLSWFRSGLGHVMVVVAVS
jgi:hypothetical protein